MRASRLLLLVAVLSACDDTEAFRTPTPSLSRMQEQTRMDPFDPGAMQAPPPDTVARDREHEDATRPAFTHTLLERGRVEFDIVCATCHGVLGDGVSVVADRMESRKPPSLHDARIVALSDARLLQIIVQGYGLMPALGHEVMADERWAVVAYVRALQKSQRVRLDELPAEERASALQALAARDNDASTEGRR